MDEILPGLWHWTARHPRIGMRVSAYYVPSARAAIDPLLPEDEGLEWFRAGRPVEQVLLTNRHHLRHSEALSDAFGATIHCHRAGLHEFAGTDVEVQPYDAGDELVPGIRAREFGTICPDDAVLHIAVGPGALAFADGLVNSRGGLGFVSDALIGDDPEAVKRASIAALARLLEEEFDALLFAHGHPVASGGKAALREFVEAGS